jgi:hypothetical protein
LAGVALAAVLVAAGFAAALAETADFRAVAVVWVALLDVEAVGLDLGMGSTRIAAKRVIIHVQSSSFSRE